MEKKKIVIKSKKNEKDQSMINLYNSLKDQDFGDAIYLGDDLYLLSNGEII
tara:strand:- start:1250 stop:1402 length:153 start_codon:yes stop_codon:yes gene_type:complete